MLNHKGTKIIESSRLILRPFTMEDAEAMYRNWASDPAVTKYLTWPTHSDLSVTRLVLENWLKGYSDENFYQWAIVPRDLGEPIGSISVVKINEQAERAEIGYCIGKNWWHRGYTSEALKLLIDFLFDEVGFNRIEACHDTDNPNSSAVMKKCGMSYEGTLRQYGRNNRGLVDIMFYGILRRDRT